MPTENRSNDANGWIACDDGLHLIQMDKNLSHYGWVFRKINGGLPYSVREATAHEMAHALARQHLRIGVAQIAGQAPADPDEVDRLREELKASREIGVSDQRTIRNLVMERDTLRAQLAEAHALLREIHDGTLSGYQRWIKIEQALSASAEPSEECAHSYANGHGCPECGMDFGAEPSAPECSKCGSLNVDACIANGCWFQQEQSAPVERDEDVLTETLRTCEKWFVKHSPTAPLIGGFGDAEHPMLTCIRAALERKP